MKLLERYLMEHEGKVYKCEFGNQGCDQCELGSRERTLCDHIKDKAGHSFRSHCNTLINHDRAILSKPYLRWVFFYNVADKGYKESTQTEEEIAIINQIL